MEEGHSYLGLSAILCQHLSRVGNASMWEVEDTLASGIIAQAEWRDTTWNGVSMPEQKNIHMAEVRGQPKAKCWSPSEIVRRIAPWKGGTVQGFIAWTFGGGCAHSPAQSVRGWAGREQLPGGVHLSMELWSPNRVRSLSAWGRHRMEAQSPSEWEGHQLGGGCRSRDGRWVSCRRNN